MNDRTRVHESASNFTAQHRICLRERCSQENLTDLCYHAFSVTPRNGSVDSDGDEIEPVQHGRDGKQIGHNVAGTIQDAQLQDAQDAGTFPVHAVSRRSASKIRGVKGSFLHYNRCRLLATPKTAERIRESQRGAIHHWIACMILNQVATSSLLRIPKIAQACGSEIRNVYKKVRMIARATKSNWSHVEMCTEIQQNNNTQDISRRCVRSLVRSKLLGCRRDDEFPVQAPICSRSRDRNSRPSEWRLWP